MEVPQNLREPQNVQRMPNMKCLLDFSVEKEIGEGSFSTVYLAREKDGKKREVAMKVCLKREIVKQKMVPYIHREKDVLAFLSKDENQHPGVVALLATFQDTDSLYFVVSYAKYGDLVHLIDKQPNSRLTVDDARYYAANLLSALVHIHNLGIIHRDVKPENLLVEEDGRIILTDFGSSKFLKDYATETTDGTNGRRRSFVGTAQFVTPEMLNGSQMGPSSDLWSFAVVIFYFLTGKHLFDDLSEYLIFKRIQDILYTIPEDFVDSDAKDLIERVIVIKATDRLTSSQIKDHHFFKSINFEKLQDLEPPKIYETL